MKLVDADPKWFRPVEPDGPRIGVTFRCPRGCAEGVFGNGSCGGWIYVPFANPLDGAAPPARGGWNREGETFEAMTLSPSILIPVIPPTGAAPGFGCGWHGHVIAGVIVEA